MIMTIDEALDRYARTEEQYKKFCDTEMLKYLDAYSDTHTKTINKLLIRSEWYTDLPGDLIYNGARFDLLKRIKIGDIFDFGKVSFWSDSDEFIRRHETNY